MGSHFETMEAKATGVGSYRPGEEIGDDTVPSGMYAIGFDLSDGGAFFVGTAAEIEAFGQRIGQHLDRIRDMAARPLTLHDFKPDEDGNYQCPRCTDTQLYEPLDYESLSMLITDIRDHITGHNGQGSA